MHGKEFLTALLERVPLESEKKAMKVIQTCKNFGLDETGECQFVSYYLFE